MKLVSRHSRPHTTNHNARTTKHKPQTLNHPPHILNLKPRSATLQVGKNGALEFKPACPDKRSWDDRCGHDPFKMALRSPRERMYATFPDGLISGQADYDWLMFIYATSKIDVVLLDFPVRPPPVPLAHTHSSTPPPPRASFTHSLLHSSPHSCTDSPPPPQLLTHVLHASQVMFHTELVMDERFQTQ